MEDTVEIFSAQFTEMGQRSLNDQFRRRTHGKVISLHFGNNNLLGYQTIGGVDHGVGAMVAGNDDFFLGWDLDPLVPYTFAYSASSNNAGVGSVYVFDRFSIDPAPVPEPSTFLLLGGGLAGLAFVARRRRKE